MTLNLSEIVNVEVRLFYYGASSITSGHVLPHILQPLFPWENISHILGLV